MIFGLTHRNIRLRCVVFYTRRVVKLLPFDGIRCTTKRKKEDEEEEKKVKTF